MLYKKLGDPDHSGMQAHTIAAEIRDCQIELVIAIGITDGDCPKSNSIAPLLIAESGMYQEKKENSKIPCSIPADLEKWGCVKPDMLFVWSCE